MKYALILIVIVILVRIDFVIDQVVNLKHKIQERLDTPAPQTTAVESETIAVPISEDKTLKQDTRSGFFLLVDQFQATPNLDNKARLIDYLKQHPKLFSDKLEKDLETKIYGLRGLFQQGNTEIFVLIQELMSIFAGENIEMLKRFLSLSIDVNFELFLKHYNKLKDGNCVIAAYIADPVSEDDKLNLYYEREEAFTNYLAQEKLELTERGFALRCQQILALQIDKIIKPAAPATPTSVSPDAPVEPTP